MANVDEVDKELGMTLKQRIKERGMTQEQFGAMLTPSVTQGVISQWLRGKERIPRGRYEQIAEVLRIDVREILSVVSYARTPEQLERWRLDVMQNEPDLVTKVVLMSLPHYLRADGEAHVSEEQVAADVEGLTLPRVEECWQRVVESQFVERVGLAKWVFKLKLVEHDESILDVRD